MTRRGLALLTSLLLVVAIACSEPPRTRSTGGSAVDEADAGRPEGTDESPDDDASPEVDQQDDEADKRRSPGDGGAVDADDDVMAGDDSPAGEAPTEDDFSTAIYPASGRYLYRQSGYEELCQASQCRREKLPASQTVDVSYKSRSRETAVVVADTQASRERSIRTTTRFTRDAASVTEILLRFSYRTVKFSNVIDPRPPIDSLMFPLETGRSWSSRWRARTSGTYRAEVLDEETLTVAGGAVRAFRVQTNTRFRGEFRGTANITLWIDPATKAVVKSTGKMDLAANYGQYRTSFATVLRAAPGY